MEPLKINVEVSFNEETLDVLKRIAAAMAFVKLNNEGVKDVVAEMPKEAPAETAVEDMPDFTAEEIKKAEETVKKMEPAKAVKEITDEQLMEITKGVVAQLKKAGKPATIVRTQVFSKFGISASTGCPKERREELVNDLNALVDAI